MKYTLIIFALMVFAFVGCQPKVQELTVKPDQLSQKTSDYEITVNRSVFSSANAEVNKSCQVLNDEIQKYVNSVADSLKADATEFFQTYVTDTTERPVWNYELMVEDSVFMATDRYVSVRLVTYAFMGGAHGMTNFMSFNYDVKNKKLLAPEEVLNYNDVTGINDVLKANFKNPDDCFTTRPTLDLVTTINFNPTAVCFTYAQYTLGAYACGIAEVSVPREELKDCIFIK